ncbi:unnamed protein product [Effrenium voratum]|nr:unnamed protein product [Effrenium voratum]|mmetsp:Transcript_78531/g.188377  ORF Transcript_78531/g.188377 Transcript_78531/m.188377 type:complete len:256 (-) Transcript_78531:211-978(-)
MASKSHHLLFVEGEEQLLAVPVDTATASRAAGADREGRAYQRFLREGKQVCSVRTYLLTNSSPRSNDSSSNSGGSGCATRDMEDANGDTNPNSSNASASASGSRHRSWQGVKSPSWAKSDEGSSSSGSGQRATAKTGYSNSSKSAESTVDTNAEGNAASTTSEELSFVPGLMQDSSSDGSRPEAEDSPSKGMLANHELGVCKPCRFYLLKDSGCRLGSSCSFCHFCSKDEARAAQLRIKYEDRREKRRKGLIKKK